MLSADGIVLGSPVYINGVTAQLKTMIDRLADAIHCQLLSGKYGCAVTTTGSSGDAAVLSYMNYFLNELGVVTVGGSASLLAVIPGRLKLLLTRLPSLERRSQNRSKQSAHIRRRRRRSQIEEHFRTANTDKQGGLGTSV
jgi:multimeric flavodoxin WrbA